MRILFISLLLLLTPVFSFAQLPESREEITLSFAPVVKKSIPAVVNIFTSHKEKLQVSPLFNDPMFKEFFGNSLGDMPRERIANSLGSGVIVGKEGLIVTSYHVVKGSDDIKIILSDKREFKGKIVKIDERSDLAVLKVETEGASLPALELRDSDTLEVGDLVLAIGNPFGVGQTVTSGIISALARSNADVSNYQFFIQTDAAINPGNSGGALVDMQGRLIGINTAIYSRTGGYQGIGFAIPSNMVSAVLKGKANTQGNIIRPWFGVAVQPVTREIAEAKNMPAAKGVLVQKVAKDSPAENAGIKAGDVIISIGNGEVDDAQSVNFRIATAGIQIPVNVTLWRGGKEQTLSVTFTYAPSVNLDKQTVTLKGNHPLNGVTVTTLTPELAEQYDLKIDRECIIVLKGNSNYGMFGASIQKGDIILGINKQEVTNVEALQQLLNHNARRLQITLVRGGMEITMILGQ